MLKFISKFIFVIVFFFSLGVCAEANPLYGTWDVASIKAGDLITQLSLDRYKEIQPKKIVFAENEMGVVIQGKEKRIPVKYKQVNDKTWAFSIDDKVWNEVTIQDKDTLVRKEIKENDTEVVYTLKREKK